MKEVMILAAFSDEENEQGFKFVLINPIHKWYLSDDVIILGETTANYTAPKNLDDNDLRKKAIETLKAKQQEVIANAQVKANKYQTMIDKLLLLTYQV